MNKKLKEVLTQLLIIGFFVLLSFAYFSPIIEGKVIRQMDLEHAIGVGQEAKTFKEAENRDITWTNSLFGGMPTYQITGISDKNVFTPVRRFLTHVLPYATVSTFFLYLLGFYLLLLSFRINKWISVIGAVAFALSSYNIIIIAAGHVTKTYAIAFMPIVLSGFIHIFNRKYILGVVLALFGLILQIGTSHIQIIYYTALLVGLYVIFRFFWDLKEKKLKNFGLATALAAGVAILAVLPNTGKLWRAYEMSKYSIRGKSEITINKNKDQGDGLDKDYALAWSYGVGESFSLFIPNIKGGGSGRLGESEVAMEEVNNRFREMIKEQNHYWGKQPFTSGPVYLGAIVVFLFVLGMFIVKNKLKWWLFAATIISVMLAWGKNFGLLTDFFFYHFPFYDKFRTVSMILVIASVTVPLMAFLTVQEIIKDKKIIKNNLKKLGIAFGLTGGLALIFWLIPGFFSFITEQESQYFNQILQEAPQQKSQINEFISQLKDARIAIFKADAIRSFAYILLAAGLLFFYSTNKKLNKLLFVGILGLLILVDMWTIDRRYLSNDDFMTKRKAKANFQPSQVDKIVQKDTDKYFRVLNINTSTFNDAYTSYFHKSIGGYHGAKLRRYQDVIEIYLQDYISVLRQSMQDTGFSPNKILKQMDVLNMLNTKYIIYSQEYFPIVNTNAYGNGWFVDKYEFVKNADEEITTLEEVNLRRTAIINKNKFNVSKLPEIGYTNDTTRSVVLTEYKPDRLKFKVNSSKGGFVVFSDIYYPNGWKATIDGKKTKIYQTDYILRGIVVPAGQHKVKFEFKPAAVFVAQKIELISSIFAAIVLLAGIYFLIRTNVLKNDNSEEEKQNTYKKENNNK